MRGLLNNIIAGSLLKKGLRERGRERERERERKERERERETERKKRGRERVRDHTSKGDKFQTEVGRPPSPPRTSRWSGVDTFRTPHPTLPYPTPHLPNRPPREGPGDRLD